MKRALRSSLPVLLILFPLSASAQLSQLDFDSDRKSAFEVASESGEAKELLDEMTGVSKSEDSPAESMPAEDTDSRAALSSSEELVTPKPVWLIPASSGPEVDAETRDTITSFIGWQAAEGKSCGEPADDTQKLMKSRALGDVISRLTGEKDIASRICQEKCQEEQQATISRLKVVDMKGGSFKLSLLEGACTYQMKSPKNGWTKIQVQESTCSCGN